jgi:hypothetical protein
MNTNTRQHQNENPNTDEWYTPQWLIEKLGPFDLDPCSPMVPPFQIAPVSYNKEQDGLTHEWPKESFVWLNPPYSRLLLKKFVIKMVEHNNGIALLINRQDNLLFQDIIFPKAASMIFMRHRVKFLRPEGESGNPFFGSCLVAFGSEADRRLRQCDITGKFVVLNL